MTDTTVTPASVVFTGKTVTPPRSPLRPSRHCGHGYLHRQAGSETETITAGGQCSSPARPLPSRTPPSPVPTTFNLPRPRPSLNVRRGLLYRSLISPVCPETAVTGYPRLGQTLLALVLFTGRYRYRYRERLCNFPVLKATVPLPARPFLGWNYRAPLKPRSALQGNSFSKPRRSL